MRYVFLGNGKLALDVLRWLVEKGEPPVGLVVHPPDRARQRDDLISAAGLDADYVREAPTLQTAEGVAWLRSLDPDRLISVLFGYVLGESVLAIPRGEAVNLHLAYLPHNRGANPNVWSIVERTPAGVTLHVMEAKIDTGDIIAQQIVQVAPTDTGASLYAKLETAGLDLFCAHWHELTSADLPRSPQAHNGSVHRTRDLDHIDRIDPDRSMRAGELIDIVRARTFPPYKGAYLNVAGRRIYLRLELVEEDH